jgi:predicted dehydrogenase
MENGATIFLESSWALNVLESREAATTLCGTKAGAQINSGMSFRTNELVYNTARNGMLTEEKNSAGGAIAFFEGGSNKPEVLEAKQWLEAVLYDKEPLVKPEQAFVVTKILDAVYKSAETGKEIVFEDETVLSK